MLKAYVPACAPLGTGMATLTVVGPPETDTGFAPPKFAANGDGRFWTTKPTEPVNPFTGLTVNENVAVFPGLTLFTVGEIGLRVKSADEVTPRYVRAVFLASRLF